LQKPFIAAGRHDEGWTEIMKARDLRVSVLIAAAWLLGITMYSMMKGPSPTGDEVGILNVSGPIPATSTALSGDGLSKHSKLPSHWAHQRWGAV